MSDLKIIIDAICAEIDEYIKGRTDTSWLPTTIIYNKTREYLPTRINPDVTSQKIAGARELRFKLQEIAKLSFNQQTFIDDDATDDQEYDQEYENTCITSICSLPDAENILDRISILMSEQINKEAKILAGNGLARPGLYDKILENANNLINRLKTSRAESVLDTCDIEKNRRNVMVNNCYDCNDENLQIDFFVYLRKQYFTIVSKRYLKNDEPIENVLNSFAEEILEFSRCYELAQGNESMLNKVYDSLEKIISEIDKMPTKDASFVAIKEELSIFKEKANKYKAIAKELKNPNSYANVLKR